MKGQQVMENTFELPLWPFEWLNQIQANGLKRNANKRKGRSSHCLDSNYARMWFIHIVAPTNSEGYKVDINKAYTISRWNTMNNWFFWFKCQCSQLNIRKVMVYVRHNVWL